MLQIIGDSLMIASRMDNWHGDRPDQKPHHPQRRETEGPSARRRSWIRFAGLKL